MSKRCKGKPEGKEINMIHSSFIHLCYYNYFSLNKEECQSTHASCQRKNGLDALSHYLLEPWNVGDKMAPLLILIRFWFYKVIMKNSWKIDCHNSIYRPSAFSKRWILMPAGTVIVPFQIVWENISIYQLHIFKILLSFTFNMCWFVFKFDLK